MSTPESVFERALLFCAEAHRGAKRKLGSTPYILHPMEVATIAATLTSDEEILAAALLHDVIEDTRFTEEDVRSHFGNRIADLVLSETEDKMRDRPANETWRIRKEKSLSVLTRSSDPGVKIIWLSDKLSNIRSFYRNYLTLGSAMWERFNQRDPAQHAWYYRTIRQLTQELSDTPAWQEFTEKVNFIFKDIKDHE